MKKSTTRLEPTGNPSAPSGKRIAWAFACLLLVGCGIEPETVAQITAAARQVSPPSSPSPTIAAKATQAEFNPPYPDRDNPFEFPIDLLGEQTSDPVKTVGQISVMGFADVGRPTVMLKTPRDVYSLGIGESVDGITVIAINPPAVDLQLGTLNWTAHLFDAR